MLTRQTPSWLEKAVFYEIYPQTFFDSNNDGIGDLPGIQAKLDYIQALGANAIWLNPCFASPFGDAGYDVSDFYQVAPRYGTNADLVALFQAAHQRGMRVILDLVAGHTSSEHPWFIASSKHERNEYSDWFIWTDQVWGPTPPELITVRGSAERDGAYIANFFYFQPALNYGFAHPDPRYPWQQPVDAPGPKAVRQELMNIMKFWLDLGCDGFRVDIASSLVKNDPDKQGTCAYWQEVRTWLDRAYPDAVLVAEWDNPSAAIPAGFHMSFYFHWGTTGYTALFRKNYPGNWGSDPYGFSFFDKSGHGNIQNFLDDYQRHYQATRELGYVSIVSGNHDINPRLGEGRDQQDLKVAFAFLLTMPGVPYIYYGDEIGMRNVHDLPSKEGGYHRTGSRTPMQWDGTLNAGFSHAHPNQLYLPVDPSPDRPTVAHQEADTDSLLHDIRRLNLLRQEHPALSASADFQVIYAEAGKYPFVYQRSAEGETILFAVNPSASPVEVALPASLSLQEPTCLFGTANALRKSGIGWTLHLPGVSSGIYSIG